MMRKAVQVFIFSLFLFGVMPRLALAEFAVQIAHYEWPQNSSVDEVLQIPQFRSVLARYDEMQNAMLIIRYPGGDDGYRWGMALRNSLVSLGIQSSEILLEPGSGVAETLLLIVSEAADF